MALNPIDYIAVGVSILVANAITLGIVALILRRRLRRMQGGLIGGGSRGGGGGAGEIQGITEQWPSAEAEGASDSQGVTDPEQRPSTDSMATRSRGSDLDVDPDGSRE